MLTRAQTNCYQENGFLVLKQLLPETEIEMLRQELNWMINSAPIHLGANENRYNQVVEHPEDYAFTVLDPDSGNLRPSKIASSGDLPVRFRFCTVCRINCHQNAQKWGPV